jgi:hypothetical protein
VGDINMRRGFLDKRGCIETTFRLKHEKDKEVRGDIKRFSYETTTFIVTLAFFLHMRPQFLSTKTHPSAQLDIMANPLFATQKIKEELK